MSTRSKIEWTDVTWNPVTGCDQISAGCDNCYALALARRLKAMGSSKYQNDGNAVTSGPGFGVTTHMSALRQPYGWSSPKNVFVNSMSDLFHAHVPLGFIQDVLKVISETPWHNYQVLTKRPMRARKLAKELHLPSNLWLGVSVESYDVVGRIDELRRIPAAVKFLSCEPLIGPLHNLDLNEVDWVIAGGESGPNARPMREEWATEIRDQCIKQKVPFFFKQWGGRTPKSNGRSLEGRTWDEFPIAAPVMVETR